MTKGVSMKRLVLWAAVAGSLAAAGHGRAPVARAKGHSTHVIHRSAAAKRAFTKGHPCPGTGATSGPCRGYVIDHVKPLACGGVDAPENMQWQTKVDGVAKDKWERRGCVSR